MPQLPEKSVSLKDDGTSRPERRRRVLLGLILVATLVIPISLGIRSWIRLVDHVESLTTRSHESSGMNCILFENSIRILTLSAVKGQALPTNADFEEVLEKYKQEISLSLQFDDGDFAPPTRPGEFGTLRMKDAYDNFWSAKILLSPDRLSSPSKVSWVIFAATPSGERSDGHSFGNLRSALERVIPKLHAAALSAQQQCDLANLKLSFPTEPKKNPLDSEPEVPLSPQVSGRDRGKPRRPRNGL